MADLSHVTVSGVSAIIGSVLGSIATVAVSLYRAYRSEQRADRFDGFRQLEALHRDCEDNWRKSRAEADALRKEIAVLRAEIAELRRQIAAQQ